LLTDAVCNPACDETEQCFRDLGSVLELANNIRNVCNGISQAFSCIANASSFCSQEKQQQAWVRFTNITSGFLPQCSEFSDFEHCVQDLLIGVDNMQTFDEMFVERLVIRNIIETSLTKFIKKQMFELNEDIFKIRQHLFARLQLVLTSEEFEEFINVISREDNDVADILLSNVTTGTYTLIFGGPGATDLSLRPLDGVGQTFETGFGKEIRFLGRAFVTLLENYMHLNAENQDVKEMELLLRRYLGTELLSALSKIFIDTNSANEKIRHLMKFANLSKTNIDAIITPEDIKYYSRRRRQMFEDIGEAASCLDNVGVLPQYSDRDNFILHMAADMLTAYASTVMSKFTLMSSK